MRGLLQIDWKAIGVMVTVLAMSIGLFVNAGVGMYRIGELEGTMEKLSQQILDLREDFHHQETERAKEFRADMEKIQLEIRSNREAILRIIAEREG